MPCKCLKIFILCHNFLKDIPPVTLQKIGVIDLMMPMFFHTNDICIYIYTSTKLCNVTYTNFCFVN